MPLVDVREIAIRYYHEPCSDGSLVKAILGVLVNYLEHNMCDAWVELCACVLLDFVPYDVLRKVVAIHPVGCHGVVAVGDADDAGFERNLILRQPIWIAPPVKALVMPACAAGELGHRFDLAQNVSATGGMRLYECKFLIRQLPSYATYVLISLGSWLASARGLPDTASLRG